MKAPERPWTTPKLDVASGMGAQLVAYLFRVER